MAYHAFGIITLFTCYLAATCSFTDKPQSALKYPKNSLISAETKSYTEALLKRWNSPGLSIAVVRRDDSEMSEWLQDFAGFGIARDDGTPMTPDTLFAIASNSKLFLAASIGLLIHNETLCDLRGKRLSWNTKIRDVIPEWSLIDGLTTNAATIQDLLSHRTGIPRHDLSYGKIGLQDTISTLRYLRPSAEFRETFQYNNLMYSTLSHIPQLLLNQSYSSYVSQHIFTPLGMSASTFSVKAAELSQNFADGYQYDLEDIPNGKNGTRRPTVPYFLRPGTEESWAGPGGVLSSARDLAIWTSMLLNKGRHPQSNATIVPEDVIERLAYGRAVAEGGEPRYAEISPKVYGAGQFRYSYRGHEIIEHGGNNPGYKTQVSRLPQDNLAVVALSNDARGGFLMESVKWRIIDDLLNLQPIDWNSRYEKEWSDFLQKSQQHTPRPEHPRSPSGGFDTLTKEVTFEHPAYGALRLCSVTPSERSRVQYPLSVISNYCEEMLSSEPIRRLVADIDQSVPTFVTNFDRLFSTHLLLRHFDGNLFNLTSVWTNWEVREAKMREHQDADGRKYGYGERDRGDLVLRWLETFEVELVNEGDDRDGFAFRGGFWGKEGPDSRSPGGIGEQSAEVWFKRTVHMNNPIIGSGRNTTSVNSE